MSMAEAIGRVQEIRASLSPSAATPPATAPSDQTAFRARLDAALTPASLTNSQTTVPPDLAPLVRDAAKATGLDPALLAAVARTESGFNLNAVSPAGAQGLMQLMPATARGLGVENPLDPTESLNGGARHLRGLLDRFGGDVRLALAGYNAGPEAVRRAGGVPPYAETQTFVDRVLVHYEELATAGA